jgi:hypothetical protein
MIDVFAARGVLSLRIGAPVRRDLISVWPGCGVNYRRYVVGNSREA